MRERLREWCDMRSHKSKPLPRLFPDKTLKLYSSLIPIISANCQKFSNLNFSPPVKASRPDHPRQEHHHHQHQHHLCLLHLCAPIVVIITVGWLCVISHYFAPSDLYGAELPVSARETQDLRHDFETSRNRGRIKIGQTWTFAILAVEITAWSGFFLPASRLFRGWSLEGESVSRMQTRDLVNLFRWSKICILASSLPRVEDMRRGKERAKQMQILIFEMSVKCKQVGRQILMKYICLNDIKCHSIGSTNEKHCYSWNNKEEWNTPQLHSSLGGCHIGVMWTLQRCHSSHMDETLMSHYCNIIVTSL